LENGPNFRADVTPLNINIFRKNFAHVIFSPNGTILKSSTLTFQNLLFFGPHYCTVATEKYAKKFCQLKRA